MQLCCAECLMHRCAITSQELSHQDTIRQLKVEQAKEVTKLRQEFELTARELGAKYEKKMKMLRDELELKRKQVGPMSNELSLNCSGQVFTGTRLVERRQCRWGSMCMHKWNALTVATSRHSSRC